MGVLSGCCESGKEKALSALSVGEGGVVARIEGDGSLKRRILEMGLVPGTQLRVERKAPLNDPVSVWFRGYELSLRVDEADAVIIRPAGCAGCPGGCR
ncbi:MAG: ferrous iron transport protein A [Synergistales bacterium]|jgi:ferrous iron transport protein A|uniref:FeoA family protein n=1 Tax=Aminivibrio sp. TaxID=1872489 RepID=UPI001E0CA15A|nr:ferrous iron transport protein A [Synergistaceae bacterium]MDD4021857.1 ferrous iron transport protein A [Synergistaceae bacterium]MDD4613150.1 ferrous iron transport protein A [Synergistaceae bacterium]NCC56437.1 ferrous iron transport protein A [Synergistales bacterium]